jgi:glycosyltransferase 2 family protein
MPDDAPSPAKARRKWLILAAKIVILALLVYAVRATLVAAFRQLEVHQWTADPVWLIASGVLYLAGIFPSAVYWHRLLRAADQPIRFGETIRAFYVSQIGKYVPGKAMVVVLRAGMLANPGVETPVVATSVFVETLTTMAAGSLLAGVCMLIWHRQLVETTDPSQAFQAYLFILSAFGAMLLTGLPIIPAVFKQIVRRLKIGKVDLRAADRLGHLPRGEMLLGWLGLFGCWTLQGLSLWAALVAIGAPVAADAAELSAVVATTSLAVVAGFIVAFTPGGIGARELVVAQLLYILSPHLGEANVVVAAIILRLVWLVSELVLAGALYVLGHQALRPVPAEEIPEVELPIE